MDAFLGNFIASLLHPLLYSAGIGFYLDCPSYFFLHILAYTILGNLIWNVLKHKAWWIPALAITLGVNIILFVFLYFFVKSWDVRDALTVLLFFFDLGFAAVLSAIPIGVFCYKKQKGQLSKLSEIKERTSSLQPPSIIAIISISYLPFSVLVIAAARGMQKILEGKLLFEPFSFHGICCQQVGTCLFL